MGEWGKGGCVKCESGILGLRIYAGTAWVCLFFTAVFVLLEATSNPRLGLLEGVRGGGNQAVHGAFNDC